jgi:predicted permease
LFGLFIILEASMPSAASLPIITNIRKGDSEFVSRGVFFTHLVSMITIPLWLELFARVTGYTF